MNDINPAWVDIELPPSDQATGCMPREDLLGAEYPVFESSVSQVPRDQWEGLASHREYMDEFVGRIHNQGSEGSCFPAGTLIRMADGTLKPIESVKVLDQVVTAERNIRTVTQTMVRKSTEMMRLRLNGHAVLHATPRHPILTTRGYVELGALVSGDAVAIPRYIPQQGEKWITTVDDETIWRPVQSVEQVPFVGWVFNLEVEGDHSYIADGIGVHNCVGQGTSKAFEIIYAIERGPARAVEMSAMSLYKRIGRSAGSGANIGDALKAISSEGLLPLDTPANRAKYKHVHPETGFRLALPDGWEETAKQFRVVEWFDIESFDGLVSALLLGLPVVYGRASHCICGVRPVLKNGVWYVKYANSWGNWGENGFGYDSEAFLRRRMGTYGAFAPRVTIN